MAWKLSEENFTPSLFNQLKLRASWGISGNQEIGNYAYVSTFATGNGAVFNDELNTGISPTRIANPDLQWEATKQFDVGLDAGILAGRLSGSIDYFIKNTSHLLINKPLPQSSGFNSELANIGRMSNRGFDIQLNSNNIQTHNFEWNTTLNFSHVKNKVESIGSIKNVITGSIQAVGNTSIIVPGEPLFSYYGYNVKGIFQQGDNIAQSAQPNAQPGYPIFQDTDGDDSITPADRVILGSPYPDFTFGISNSLSYKNFQFSLFITGQQGADLASADIEQNLFPPNPRRNLLAEIGLNRWSPDNPNTKWPSGINTSDYSAENMNSLIIQDASYIRLRNVRLSYTIPQKFIQSAEVYITGQNLVTLTNYIGVNPDANALGRSNVHIDVNGYPLARTFLLGFNLHF